MDRDISRVITAVGALCFAALLTYITYEITKSVEVTLAISFTYVLWISTFLSIVDINWDFQNFRRDTVEEVHKLRDSVIQQEKDTLQLSKHIKTLVERQIAQTEAFGYVEGGNSGAKPQTAKRRAPTKSSKLVVTPTAKTKTAGKATIKTASRRKTGPKAA